MTGASAERCEVAPAVISASRTTDIPAFHMRWFMERLRAGWCVRINPFNSSQRTRVSFAGCRVIVFWSKDPRPLLPHLDEIQDRGFDCLVQYTLNDYEAEQLEPRVPPLATRVRTFVRLAERLGPERVIWRFDPVMTGTDLPISRLLARIDTLGQALAPYTEKLVFSLLDLYARPAVRLRAHTPRLRPPDTAEIHELAAGLRACNAGWTHPLHLATCAERIDLSAWGIAHNACIDPELLARLHPEDAELAALCPPRVQHYLPSLTTPATPATGQASLPQPFRQSQQARQSRPAQGGWRPQCRCAPNRDIGTYSTCMHLCVYCYANNSEQAVIANLNALHRRAPGCAHL